MSSSLVTSLAGPLQLIVPLLCFAWAQRTGKSRVVTVVACTVGCMFAGLLFAIPFVKMSALMDDEQTNVPYVFFNLVMSSAVMGAGIGVVGLVLRGLGASRGRRV